MDAKEEVRNRLNVEDVVGEYIELKRSGRSFKGFSPFTSEKTPSFMVSPEKQIWHDFSSNKGGDIFSFVMEMEGVDFREALTMLARKAGVEIEQYKDGGKTAKLKRRILDALELAAKYYQQTLTKNEKAIEYVFKTRKFTKDTVRTFKIGYAPAKGDALLSFLKKKGFSESEIKAAGLSSSRRGFGLSDMFRGRIMFPLCDREGRVVGFTARILEDLPNAPKYINTPQTLAYDKSRHVYGLHLAKESIRKAGFSVIVEGNLDVITSHQAKVNNVVATAGTAMTTHQVKALSRLAQDVRIAFDQDDAGLRATERSIEVAQEVGVNLQVIDIPQGKDPDDLIRQAPELWAKAIKDRIYSLDWLLQRYEKIYDLKSAQGKREMSSKYAAILKKVTDAIEQEHFMTKLAQATDSSIDAVKRKVNAVQKSRKKNKKQSRAVQVSGPDDYAYQDSYLALILFYPETRSSLKRSHYDYMRGEERKEVFDLVARLGSKSFKASEHELHSLDNYVKILSLKAEELYGSWNSSDRTVEAIGLARRSAKDNTKKQREDLTAAIRHAEDAKDEVEAKRLLNKYHQMIRENKS